MKPKLQNYVKHNFVAKWQDEQCRQMMKNLPADVIISHIDFAENYSFMIQDEIQSMHWHSTQVTILVHITLRRVFLDDADEGDGEIVKESHFYISDDKEHDTLFVQHCLMLHWQRLQNSGFVPKEHWVFSDGCAAQFKGPRAL
jgi:hypothetical protein